MKILITGDRNYTNKSLMDKILWHFRLIVSRDEDIEIITGDASGADSLAVEIAKSLEWPYRKFTAYWDKHGLAAGPIRNRLMIAQKPDICLAFHDNLRSSKGTKDCVKQARAAGILTFQCDTNGISTYVRGIDDEEYFQ